MHCCKLPSSTPSQLIHGDNHKSRSSYIIFGDTDNTFDLHLNLFRCENVPPPNCFSEYLNQSNVPSQFCYMDFVRSLSLLGCVRLFFGYGSLFDCARLIGMFSTVHVHYSLYNYHQCGICITTLSHFSLSMRSMGSDVIVF